jgi:hypothetical protein
MMDPRLARLAWAVTAAAAAGTLALIVVGARASTPADEFGLTGLSGVAWVAAALTFATVGATVAARAPANAIGWLFCLTGAVLAVGNLAFQYADVALFVARDPLPAGRVAAVVQNFGLPPGFGLLAVALLLFPTGRLPSRRWRPALALALAGIACHVVGYALRPGPLDEPFDAIANPLGVDGAFRAMDAISTLGWLLMGASVAFAALAIARRFRGARGLEAQQLKWIALAATIVGVVIVALVLSWFVPWEGRWVAQVRLLLAGLAASAFPIAAGIAILRHKLLDIDVVINRTLVYGALTATLAAAYVGSVLLLQLVLSPGSQLTVAASTLAVAALFRPARVRIQAAVDRRFYRRRYDAGRTLERFAARLHTQLDLDALGAELVGVVAETMQPAHVSLWLRDPGASRSGAGTASGRR